MKLNGFIYIFVALITLSLVGCGSSNNPASSGNVSSGLVNVSGNVKNLEGNGSVSFYTPTAAIKNGINITSSTRSSISNDEIYTFNTDENGNFSGTIPSGNYYVIAENSNGTMRSVTSLQDLNSLRAATQIEIPTITLKETVDVTGTLQGEDGLSIENIPVYVANTPFVAFTNSEGKFKYLSVPVGTYKFKTEICIDNYIYTYYGESKIDKNNTNVNISFTKKEISDDYFTGTVTDGKTNLSDKAVTAVLSSGEIYFAVTDSNGTFKMFISENEETSWFVDMQSVTMDTSNNTITCNSSSVETVKPYGIEINEAEDDSGIFVKTNDTKITLFDSSYNILYSETFYFPAAYNINNLKAGDYYYIIESRNYKTNSYGYRFSDTIPVTENSIYRAPESDQLAIVNPRISAFSIESNIYTLGATINGSPDVASFNTFAYAINTETLGFTKVLGDVTKPTKPVLRASDDGSFPFTEDLDLSNLASGSYDIYAGFSIIYNGNCVATITTDPFPFAKH